MPRIAIVVSVLFSAVMFAQNLKAAPAYTFTPGYVPTISMSSRTLNGAPFFGIQGFNALPEYKAQYDRMNQGINDKTLNFKQNNKLDDRQIQFQYKDENGALQTVDTKLGGDVQAVGDAYQASLNAAKNTKQDSRTTGSVTVDTKYKVIPGPQTSEHICDTWYLGIEFIDNSSYVRGPGAEISTQKMCELAVNIAGGRNAVQLGGVPLVGTGEYGASPKCIKNKAPGTPEDILLETENPEGFKICPNTIKNNQQQPPNNQNQNNNFGGGNPGGSDLGGGLGAMGGLGQMLPLLLAGMLGGGQSQGQGGQQGQGQYGAGYGNQQQDLCLSQPIAPVCGNDGKTYKNSSCAEQYRARIRNNGVCPAANPTPTVTAIAITSLSPIKGSVGSMVVITGSGFSATGNSVHFAEGGSKDVSSIAGGRVILFDVPQNISGCDFWTSSIACTQPARTVTTGSYNIIVTNASGQSSNEKSFTVTVGNADVFPVAVRDSIRNIISTIFTNIFEGTHIGEIIVR